MAWSWRYETADGPVPKDGPPHEPFPSRGDAESWLGENWRELRDSGTERVTLLEEDAPVYTMPLSEEG